MLRSLWHHEQDQVKHEKRFQSSCWSQVLKVLTGVHNKPRPAEGKRKWLFDFRCFSPPVGILTVARGKKNNKMILASASNFSPTCLCLADSGAPTSPLSHSFSSSLPFSVYINEIRLLTLFLLLLDLFFEVWSVAVLNVSTAAETAAAEWLWLRPWLHPCFQVPEQQQQRQQLRPWLTRYFIGTFSRIYISVTQLMLLQRPGAFSQIGGPLTAAGSQRPPDNRTPDYDWWIL